MSNEVSDAPRYFTVAPPVGTIVWLVDSWDNVRKGSVTEVTAGTPIVKVTVDDDDPLYGQFTIMRMFYQLYRTREDCIADELKREMDRHQAKIWSLMQTTPRPPGESIAGPPDLMPYIPDGTGAQNDGRP